MTASSLYSFATLVMYNFFVCQFVLCYVMLCYVMLCYVMLLIYLFMNAAIAVFIFALLMKSLIFFYVDC